MSFFWRASIRDTSTESVSYWAWQFEQNHCGTTAPSWRKTNISIKLQPHGAIITLPEDVYLCHRWIFAKVQVPTKVAVVADDFWKNVGVAGIPELGFVWKLTHINEAQKVSFQLVHLIHNISIEGKNLSRRVMERKVSKGCSSRPCGRITLENSSIPGTHIWRTPVRGCWEAGVNRAVLGTSLRSGSHFWSRPPFSGFSEWWWRCSASARWQHILGKRRSFLGKKWPSQLHIKYIVCLSVYCIDLWLWSHEAPLSLHFGCLALKRNTLNKQLVCSFGHIALGN